jgi:3-oxoacyl-[acyl-carrier-protein] synthase-1
VKTLAVVCSVGAVTPLGLRAVEVGLAHRAAVAGMREAPLCDAEGEPITMCFLPTLDPRAVGADRALLLGQRALDEVLLGLGAGTSALRTRLIVALDPELTKKTVDGEVPAQRLVSGLAMHARPTLPQLTVEVVARGAAGPGFVLEQACEALAEGSIDVAIVGGVHSDYHPERIAALAEAGRLYRADNLDALIPGEAAAFVALARRDTARRLRAPIQAELHSVATAWEKARPDNDEPALGAAGLTVAVRTALAPLAEAKLRAGWVLTDLTFETFRHLELSAMMTRSQRFFCEPQQVDSPAQRMGHLGSAIMPLHMVLACEGFRRGFAPHPYAVSLAGSDAGERAALLLSAPS